MKTIQLSQRELSIVYSLMAPPYRAEDIRSDEFNELRNKVFYALRDAQNAEPVSDAYKFPGRWIPVSERMPDDEQEVIVQTHSGWRYVSFYDAHSRLFYDSPEGDVEYILVTHWMPLPAAPQQEGM